VADVHQPLVVENCQRLFILASDTGAMPQKSSWFLAHLKGRKNPQKQVGTHFRADYHPHALEKSYFSLSLPTVRSYLRVVLGIRGRPFHNSQM